MRRTRVQQQLSGHYTKWDEARRIHSYRCQVFLALGEYPTAPHVLYDGVQYFPPRPAMIGDSEEDCPRIAQRDVIGSQSA